MKRMKKAGLVATSVATIAVCSSLIVGSTYALFTSEDNVNIAVTAGKVSVVAEVGDLTATTALDASYEVTGKEVALQNGGSASVSGNSIVLDKVTPGDTVSFPVTVTNSSNVSTLCRLSYKVESGLLLASGLTVKVGEYDLTGKQEYATGWIELETTTYNVTVSLPSTDNDNIYQGLNTEISIAVEAVQANGAVEGTGVVDVDLPDFSAAKEAYNGGSLAVVDNAEDLAAALANGGYILLADDIEVTSLKDGNNHYPAGTVVDGNGNSIKKSNGNLSVSKDVEYRNIVFDIAGGSWSVPGVITGSAKFYNCTFNAVTPYLYPAEGADIVFDGCTFIDTILQVCYNEGANKPESSATIITNNTFIVNNTDAGSHAIVLGGGSADFWANGAETVTVSGNTFNSRYASSYIAYYIYVNKNVTLTSVPLYLENTYNGEARYAMNGVALGNQHEIKLTEGQALVGNVVYDNVTDAVAALKDGDTLVLAEGTYRMDSRWTGCGLALEKHGVTVIGAGVDETIIEDSILLTNDQDKTPAEWTIKNLTVRGTAQSHNTAICFGGNTNIENCIVNIENCKISGILFGAQLNGGQKNSTLNVKDTEFENVFCAISVKYETGAENVYSVENVKYTDCTYTLQTWGSAALDGANYYYTVDGEHVSGNGIAAVLPHEV